MDIEEVRKMNNEELEAELKDLQEEQSNLRVQKSVTTLENPMRLKNIRKGIARIKTVLRERELEEEQNGE
ncbi:MAG: 50S ribosomal protein L29 [bacterium]